MWDGAVTEMCIASGAGEPMQALAEATSLAGRGLEGNRYALG